ncbi:MAG: PaaI family thioesterase [Anaerolineae bacterium]|nr:PaaI family thioesterase [Anaerolineae bacterium]
MSHTTVPAHWHLQPTSRMCFVCGRENPVGLHIQFYEDREQQQVIVPITIPDQYQGYPGITHGGIITAILDEVSGRALMMTKGEDLFWVTAKLEMRYRQPTPTGVPLTAVGWVVRQRSRAAEVAGEIRLPDGTVTAEVAAVVVCPPAETLQSWEQEKDFWKVEQDI